ncbi:hypothetical protein HKCCD6035_08490 [Rhodobacterales bacterium HKCCD6035]|nr:hypothetical protein [Rhodobacterales bacterium HKCCD6035]
MEDEKLLEAVLAFLMSETSDFSDCAKKLAKEWPEVRVSDVIGIVLKACEVIARTFKDGENRQDICKGHEFALWLSYTAYELTQRGVDPVLMQDLHKVEGAD